MKLIDEWKSVAKRAWSLRLAIVAAFFAAAEVGLPFFTDVIPPHTLAILSAIAAAGSALARLIAQPSLQSSQDGITST